MKQIVITPAIKVMAKEYADNLFKDKGNSFIQPIDALNNLIIDLSEVNGGLANRESYIKYVQKIIHDYEKLKNLLPSEFSTYKRQYDKIIVDDLLSVSVKHRRMDLPSDAAERAKLTIKTGVFCDEIVKRMHYRDCRLYLGPYMKKLDINTCVYCNLAKATYSSHRDEVYYPFDHNLPKDKYPFLCICFFNLYPSCTSCNGHKLNDAAKGFKLYVKKKPVFDPFVFEIERNKIVEGDPNTVNVVFKARQNSDLAMTNDYNETYRVTDFYNADDERRSNYKLIKDIDRYRGSYPDATKASLGLVIDRGLLFLEVLGVKDGEDNIFTDVKKKLILDTAKDAKLI